MKRMVWSVVTLLAIGSMSVAQERRTVQTGGLQIIAGGVHTGKNLTQTLIMDFEPERQKSIERIEFVTSRNQGKTWKVVATMTPDQRQFTFNPRKVGLYYLSSVIVFRDGSREPQKNSQITPLYKWLIDTQAPVVRITNVQREGKEVVVNWLTEEKFLNQSATVIEYKSTSKYDTQWAPVPTTDFGNLTVRFKPTTTGPTLVRITAFDYSGNRGEATTEVGGK